MGCGLPLQLIYVFALEITFPYYFWLNTEFQLVLSINENPVNNRGMSFVDIGQSILNIFTVN